MNFTESEEFIGFSDDKVNAVAKTRLLSNSLRSSSDQLLILFVISTPSRSETSLEYGI